MSYASPYSVAYNYRKLEPKRVLMHLQGSWHIEMYANIFAELPEIYFAVFVEVPVEEAIRLAETLPDNVLIIPNIVDVLLQIDTFGVVLTTLATPHRGHVRGIQIFQACSALGIPVLEIQHGLFQIGINYYDVSRVSGSGFKNSSIGFPARNFRDGLITWGGPDGIGLPQFHRNPPAEDKGFVLILTNMHWSIYSDLERLMFYDGIRRLVLDHSDTRFFWKPHQAEIQPAWLIYTPG